MRKEMAGWGALVVGRHLYDLTNAWNGRHPLDVTTVVLTHHPPEDRPLADEDFVFVTDGIEAAVAKAREIAGDKDVAVNGGQMARQALEAGLLDEIGVDLVPVILGDGTRLFADLTSGPLEFDGPFLEVQGIGVTHLRYRVRKERAIRSVPAPDAVARRHSRAVTPRRNGSGVDLRYGVRRPQRDVDRHPKEESRRCGNGSRSSSLPLPRSPWLPQPWPSPPASPTRASTPTWGS